MNTNAIKFYFLLPADVSALLENRKAENSTNFFDDPLH